MNQAQHLLGLAVLVMEDDYYLADDTQRMLEAAGARVAGPYGRVAESLARLRESDIDCGVLDVNLGGGRSFAAARALKQQRVPFVFLTGYGPEAIPEDLTGVELLEKPIDARQLIDAVARVCGRGDQSST